MIGISVAITLSQIGGWAVGCPNDVRYYPGHSRILEQRGFVTRRTHRTPSATIGDWEAYEVTDKGLDYLRKHYPDWAKTAEETRQWYRDSEARILKRRKVAA